MQPFFTVLKNTQIKRSLTSVATEECSILKVAANSKCMPSQAFLKYSPSFKRAAPLELWKKVDASEPPLKYCKINKPGILVCFERYIAAFPKYLCLLVKMVW